MHELFAAYARYAAMKKLRWETLFTSEGHVVARISGPNVWAVFRHEPGRHCVQRCPSSDRAGRRHTSIVSVAVLPIPDDDTSEPLNEADIEVKTQGGSGPGGQHQNKTDSAVRMRHRPTGIQVFINGRDQHRNRRDALRILTAKVHEHVNSQRSAEYAAQRRSQIGSGARGDKVRTYNFIESRVVDHRRGTRTKQIRQVMKGRLDLLLIQTLEPTAK